MLEIKTLKKTYRKWGRAVEALKGVTWKCERGIYGILGHNGAGKTTLLRICAGLLSPTEGTVLLDGQNISVRPEYLKERLGYMPQEFGVIPHWTAEEFLEFLLLAREDKMDSRERRNEIQRVLNLVRVGEERKRVLWSLSGGMRRRVGIAQALLKSPSLLLLDEPTSGMDPEARVFFRSLLQEISLNSTILLSTHLVEDALRICREIMILHAGISVICGTPTEIAASVSGKVFQVKRLKREDLQNLRKTGIVVELPEGENGTLSARFIGEHPPELYSFIPEEPKLEDAFLYYAHSGNF